MDEFLHKKDRKQTDSIKWDQVKQIFNTDADDILPMWVADMDFPAPRAVNDALIERAKHGIYGYTFINDTVYEAVTSWLKNKHAWEIDPSSLSFSPSVLTSLYNAIQLFTNEGDNILLQTPVYTPFFNIIEDAGRTILRNPLHFNGETYEIDFVDLEKKMQNNVKAFVLCSPHNPVGRVWTEEELRKMAELALKYDVLILSDEIHADLVFKPHKHIPIASLSKDISNQTITFMSPTKTFNLAGLHVSYMVTTDKKKGAKMDKLLSQQGFRMLNTMGIIALEAAYRHGDSWLTHLLEVIEDNKQYVINRLEKETAGKVRAVDAEGTYLLWLDFTRLDLADKQLQRFIIDKARVGLNAGSSYGVEGEQFMRINLACHKETLTEGINRIVKAVNEK